MDDERDTPNPTIKMEDAPPIEAKANDGKLTYKSWKKKYRKMRIKFDQKMHEGEELHQREVKAHATSKRLAIEVDRLLDLLFDINDATQIPPEKRFNLSLPTDPSAEFSLEIDDPPEAPHPDDPGPNKSLKDLLADVPHMDYAATVAKYPHVVETMRGCADSPVGDPSRADFPPTFLTMDDVDNYLYEIDLKLRKQGHTDTPMVPTMASLAKERANAAAAPAASLGSSAAARDAAGQAAANRDFALRNPTSVYNWLRKHAPKTFLQDHEGGSADKEADDHGGGGGAGSRGGRKSMGEGRGGKAGSRASKRTSAATSRDKRKDADDTMEDIDDEVSFNTGGGKGKRKRVADDDTGYRPKGGSSRPTKKKRKSEGSGDAAPAKRSRKSDAGSAIMATADGEELGHDD